MSAERLRLPEPAGALWTKIRNPLKQALGSRGAPTALKLGGGTMEYPVSDLTTRISGARQSE